MELERDNNHSDSINYLLKSKLGFFLRNGMALIFILCFVVVLFLHFIKVPDSIDSKFVLTSSNPPKMLVSKISGRVSQKFVDDKMPVTDGQLLLEMENQASFADIKLLDSLIEKVEALITQKRLDQVTIIEEKPLGFLGEIQNYYEVFKKSNNEYAQLIANKQYQREKELIENKQANLDLVYANLIKQKSLYTKEFSLSHQDYVIDSILATQNGLIEPLLRKTEAEVVQRQISLLSIEQSIIANVNSRNDLTQQLINLDKVLMQYKNNFIQSFYGLKAALQDWKSKFLIAAPITGIASFNRNIHEGMQTQAGEPLLYVIPNGSKWICELLIPQTNLGKLKKGNKCILKFDSYNYEEYGIFEGTVASISDIPQEVKNQGGSENAFLVKVSLADSLVSNYNKTVEGRYGLMGTASIVLDDKSLLEKLFLDKFLSLVKSNN